MDTNIIELQLCDGTSAKVHLYGATVTSWISGGSEQLFLSNKSKMDGTKAIRGGIPLVFPNFGPWDLGPQHGFARISWWRLISNEKIGNECCKAEFKLEENDQTKAMWDFKFSLLYEVELKKDALKTSLTVTNTGAEAFNFTTLLHTYFRVSDIGKCSITGLKGCTYTDKVSKGSDKIEEREEIQIDDNVDSVYMNAGKDGHTISSPGRMIRVEKHNLPDSVLWNPWATKAKEMSDFDDDGYINMVCVEPGYVSNRKVLPPGESFDCSQTLNIVVL